jgi:hypothetical protein
VKPINPSEVQAALQRFVGRPVYLHLETTNGAYAGERTISQEAMAVCAFVRNAQVRIERATLAGSGPFRAGLQIEHGWIFAEGLTDWELDGEGRLLLAGHDPEGRLAVALELSPTPFPA